MNSNSNSLSPCLKFIEVLLKLSREIYLDIHDQQWKKVEMYTKQCSCENPKISNPNSVYPKLCSHELFILMLKQHNVFRQNGYDLSTFLMNCISYIYWEQPCMQHDCYDFLDYVVAEQCMMEENDIFRVMIGLDGRCELMKMFVNLDLVSSSGSKFMNRFILENLEFVRCSINPNHSDSNTLFEYIRRSTFFCDVHLNCLKRIYLVTIAAKATQLKVKKQENEAKKYIYCLRMYFAATPDLLLTINEMRCMLYICLIHLKKLHLFESHNEEFVKLMPECLAEPEPRSLTHLARCQVRLNIKNCNNLPLPKAVERLSLPLLLKKFVLGDIFEVSRKCRNISQEHVFTRSQLDRMVFRSQRF